MRGRATFALIAPLLLLSACKEKPSFEDRYDKAAKEIDARAKAMDADIAAADKAAAVTGETAPDAQTPLPADAAPSNAPSSSGE